VHERGAGGIGGLGCFGASITKQEQSAAKHNYKAPTHLLEGAVKQRLLPVLLRLERQRARSLARVLAAASKAHDRAGQRSSSELQLRHGQDLAPGLPACQY
jgi:hypothetical protein